MKRIFVLMNAVIFILGLVTFSHTEEKAKVIEWNLVEKNLNLTGTVTKIDGNKITVRDDKGRLTTVSVIEWNIKEKDLNVGNKITIKNGQMMKEPAKLKDFKVVK